MSSSSPTISITTTMLLVTVMFAALATTVEVSAKSSVAAAPPPVDCSTVVLSMSDCLSYVTKGSTTSNPEGTCCSGLKQVLKTSPGCLCQAFQQSAQFGVVLNVTKALALPSACKLHAPSATKCGLSLSPAGAPVGAVVAPAGSPFSSIENAPSSGMGSSETSPATAPSNMASPSSMGVSIHFITVCIVAASFIYGS